MDIYLYSQYHFRDTKELRLMEDQHIIYIDRLADDKVEKITCSLAPDFMDIHEKDLSFPKPIIASGEAYVASDHLVVHLDVETSARVPCKLCNESITQPIRLTHIYHTVPLSELKQPIFDLREVLRENILLESPAYAECTDASCPNKGQFAEYIQKDETVRNATADDHSNYPFAHLDEEIKKSST